MVSTQGLEGDDINGEIAVMNRRVPLEPSCGRRRRSAEEPSLLPLRPLSGRAATAWFGDSPRGAGGGAAPQAAGVVAG